jgi:hypothetical protein
LGRCCLTSHPTFPAIILLLSLGSQPAVPAQSRTRDLKCRTRCPLFYLAASQLINQSRRSGDMAQQAGWRCGRRVFVFHIHSSWAADRYVRIMSAKAEHAFEQMIYPIQHQKQNWSASLTIQPLAEHTPLRFVCSLQARRLHARKRPRSKRVQYRLDHDHPSHRFKTH